MKVKRTIELSYKDLKAASLCKSKRDVRFYLCGVYVGDGFIASTNGNIALIAKNDNAKGMDLIIPAEAIDSLVRKLGNSPTLDLVNLRELDDGYWLLNHLDSYELFKPVVGKYPDITRIDIKKPDGVKFKEYPSFDITYLSIFNKVAKTLGLGASPRIYPTTENDVAYVEIKDNVHGLLMPRRI